MSAEQKSVRNCTIKPFVTVGHVDEVCTSVQGTGNGHTPLTSDQTGTYICNNQNCRQNTDYSRPIR